MSADPHAAWPAGDDPAVAAAFLALYLADLEQGGPRSLEHYRARFPGYEELVAREHAALADARAAGPGAAASSVAGETRIGPYRLLAELGRGGQAVVHLALDTRLKRKVALKVLARLPLEREPALARFRREAEVASRLDHPGICAVLDSGVADGAAYIAMRYVEGRTLAQEIAELRRAGGPPPHERAELERVARLFEKAARALHAAHEAGVVHRDVKPGNVALTPSGEPVLLDFGLARALESDDPTLTRTGDVFGTPAYMAPEQLRGGEVGPRADVYALGATLYERLTLRPPFAAPTREGLFRAILEDGVPDPREHNPRLARDLAVVLRTALEQDPDRRYGSARDLAEDLRRYAAREPILARPPGAFVRAWRWVERNRAVASLAAGLILALGGGLAATGVLLRDSETARSELGAKKVELEAALADAEHGRLTRRQEEIQALVAQGFQEGMSAAPDGAAARFEQALALDPACKPALLGRAWIESGEPERALAALERFAGALAQDSDVLWMRGLMLELQGRTDEAQAAFARAGERESDLRLYLQGLRAVENFASLDPERARRAVALFRRAVLHAPRPQYHYLHSLLMAASYAGDRAAMEEAAAALEDHWPDSPGTWDAIAQFFLPLDPERGKRALQRCLELEPSAAPCCGLAYEAMGRGAFDEALAWFDRGIELEPSFAPVWFMKGELLLRRGDAEGARACLVESLLRDARYTPPYDALAAAHRQIGDPGRRLADLEAVAAGADCARPWLELGRLRAAAADEPGALAAFERGLALRPEDADLLREKAQLASR